MLKQLLKQLEFVRPTVIVFGYGMASSLERGLEGVASFTKDYQRLIEATQRMQPGLRYVFLSPLGRLPDSYNETRVHTSALAAYTKAINQLALKNNGVFVDLSQTAKDEELRKDSIHLNDAGYREGHRNRKTLGFDDRWIGNPHVEKLRSQILKKNVWWFHRSRPANMAYVFGFRKREQAECG